MLSLAEPLAPYVTETNDGSRASNECIRSISVSQPLSLFGGKNSKEKIVLSLLKISRTCMGIAYQVVGKREVQPLVYCVTVKLVLNQLDLCNTESL